MRYVFKVAAFMGGLGAGLRGMLEARERFADGTGVHDAVFRSLGSVDIDAAACFDFELLTGTRSLCADMHELAPAELQAFMPECPDAVFTSPPCKGFSRLLNKKKSLEARYQRLNELVYRGIFLACETWAPKRPSLIVLENVPGIVTRGEDVLNRAKKILHSYGYHVHEGQHDCGEIGGLAQHRKRYLLVARLPTSVTAFVHKPPLKRVRACGEVLELLPVPRGPDAADAGPMHALPNIEWGTWVKLSRIPAGGDWRDLPPELSLGVDGTKFGGSPGLMKVADPREPFPTVTGTAAVSSSNACAAVADGRVGPGNRSPLGVLGFGESSGTVAGESWPHNGRYSVADPRTGELFSPLRPGQPRREVHARHGGAAWEKPVGTVAGSGSNAVNAVSDPRVRGMSSPLYRKGRHARQFKVTRWEKPTGVVTGDTDVQTGALNVADPRPGKKGRQFNNHHKVRGWDQPALTIAPASQPDSGAQAVAEPRMTTLRNGMYGVMGWEEASATITGRAKVDTGPFSVADPRGQPPVIISADGCWHRPLSTLELAALQGIPHRINGKPLLLAGKKTSAWRERIGNAVPVGAGAAIASSLLKALLASKLGTWFLSNEGIWVRQRDSYVMPEETFDAA